MGEVWAARNELTNRDFAIKFLLPEFSTNVEVYERFVREAKTTGELQHPSIVDVFDVAQTTDGHPFIVMELLSGEDLGSRLDREGTLSPLRVAAYFAQIAAGLQLAHEAGVVHRDISAGNIFLARAPEGGEPIPKILDFGVSKSIGPALDERSVKTSNGAVLGNPVYMSPEQARGAESVDARTDVWSLGAVMYECLSGTTPFKSGNYNALMVDIMTRAHRPILELVPTLDRAFAELIELCLQKDRDKRIGSAQELALRLSACAYRFATDPREIGRTPRRRATDRLPPPPRRKELAAAGSPLGVRLFRGLARLRPPRALIAAAAIAAGVGIGISLAQDAPDTSAAEQATVLPNASAVSPAVPALRSFTGLAESEASVKPSGFKKQAAQETELSKAVVRSLKQGQ